MHILNISIESTDYWKFGALAWTFWFGAVIYLFGTCPHSILEKNCVPWCSCARNTERERERELSIVHSPNSNKARISQAEARSQEFYPCLWNEGQSPKLLKTCAIFLKTLAGSRMRIRASRFSVSTLRWESSSTSNDSVYTTMLTLGKYLDNYLPSKFAEIN